MNQHFDSNSADNPDEFEERLAAISLVAPSENYAKIPSKLSAASNPDVPRNWRWLVAGVIACSLAALMVTGFPFTDLEPQMSGESENALALSPATVQQNSQGELAANTETTAQYLAGTHYAELPSPVDLPASTGVEVAAFFWYPCWPCDSFEEQLSLWESELSDDVRLTRIPAIWSAAMRFHARAYYTAVTLGVVERTHRQFYTAFRKDSASISDEADLQQFFATVGVSPAEFFAAFNSPATLDLLQRAEAANTAYQVQSTPSLFVAGKYGISPAGAGGFEQMLSVTDYLIEGL